MNRFLSTPQKQRIASTVPKQTWSESDFKNKESELEAPPEGVLLKNKDPGSFRKGGGAIQANQQGFRFGVKV